MVAIDWERVPVGTTTGIVTITGHGREVTVQVEAFKPAEVTRDSLVGFAEGQGVVSIEPEHHTKNSAAGANHWARVAGYGRTLSGMRAEGLVDASAAVPGKDSPCLEYRLYLFHDGPGRGDRYYRANAQLRARSRRALRRVV